MKGKDASNCILGLVGVTKTFGIDAHQTTAVRNVSLQLSPGELVVLLGPSGSGKTTLLTLMAGLIRSTSGGVTLFGRPIEQYTSKELQEIRATRIGFVFQTFLLIESLPVVENVMLVLRFAGKSRKEGTEKVKALLGRLEIEHLAEKFPPTLSQGEKQRVAVARALVNDPTLIIADEPTASLEARRGFEMIHLLHEYARKKNRCVVVASHDLRITQFADRVFHLEDGTLQQATI